MKKMSNTLLALSIIMCTVALNAASCSKNQAQQNEPIAQNTIPKQTPEPGYIRKVFFTQYNEALRTQFADYYANPIRFQKPDIPPSNQLAVVAGKRALFYPGAKINQQKDADKLKKPMEIPFGTLLPIFAEIKTPEGSTFFHDDYYHYFYETEYDGKRGLVFGADLFGMDKDPAVTLEAWRLYTDGTSKELTPFTGLAKLPDAITGMIEDLGIAYIPAKNATLLSAQSTGSLLRAMYETRAMLIESGEDPAPLFITADLLLEAYHEIAANLEHRLLPVIELPLLKQFIQESLNYFSRVKPKDSKTQALHNKAIHFLQTAELIIGTLPEYVIEFDTYENMDIVKKKVYLKSEIFSQFPEQVQHDAENLLTAEGDWYSEIFDATINTNGSNNGAGDKQSYQTDYILNKVFTWFSLASLDINALTHLDSVAFKTRHGTIAWILYLLTGLSENEQALQTLTSLVQTESLLRQSYEVKISKNFVQFLKQEKLTPIGTWIHDPVKTLSTITRIQKKYNDTSFSKTGDKNNMPSDQGQERKLLAIFVPTTSIETTIFSQLTNPKIQNRTILSGLDFINCFEDYSLLTLSYINKFPELKNQYELIRTGFSNSTLPAIQNVQEPARSIIVLKQDKETNQQYINSPGWKIKNALTDLICLTLALPSSKLAVPPNTPVLSNSAMVQPEQKNNLPSRIKPLRPLAHWLEPRASLYKTMQSATLTWKSLISSAKTSESSLIADARNKAIDETIIVLDNFNKILAQCELIAQKELSGEKLTTEENTFILNIPQSLTALITAMPKASAFTGASLAVHQESLDGNSTSTVMYDAEEPALFIPSKRLIYRTNKENGIIELYAGPGIPYIVYIPILLPDGNRVIATGFMYSYLEFTQSVGNLTDSEWQNIVFSDEATMYKLEWE